MKTNKIFWITNSIFLVLILVATGLYIPNVISESIIKPIDSALFVLCGVANLIMLYKFKNSKNIWKAFVMLAGLIFACIGDIVLISNFMLGAIFFAIGHVIFIVFFFLIQKFDYKDIIFSLLITAFCLLLIFLLPVFDFGPYLPIVAVYAVIISFMLGKALSNFVSKRSIPNLIIFLGAFLFFFSDFMLVLSNFAHLGRIFSHLCLATYYPAEFLLAISIFTTTYEGVEIPQQKTLEN